MTRTITFVWMLLAVAPPLASAQKAAPKVFISVDMDTMMQGIDSTFDAVVFVGDHARCVSTRLEIVSACSRVTYPRLPGGRDDTMASVRRAAP